MKIKQLVALFLCLLAVEAYTDSIEYQDRGRYHEGQKYVPVNALHGIHIVNMQVSHPSLPLKFPEFSEFSFLIPPIYSQASIRVRDISGVSDYWLDKVEENWQSGEVNRFKWSSKNVLQQIKPSIRLKDLGVLVNLDNIAGNEEVIAPVVFHPISMNSIQKYVVDYIPMSTSMLEVLLYNPKFKSAQKLQNKRRVTSNLLSRFEIPVDELNLESGEYMLVFRGHSLRENNVFSKRILFYHDENALLNGTKL